MGERTKYAPGTFSWTDLTTTDQDAAKQFYGQLFGWTAVDNPDRRRHGLFDDADRRQGCGGDLATDAGAARGGRAAAVELLRHRGERRRHRRERPEARAPPCRPPPSTSWTRAAWRSSRTRKARSSWCGSPSSTSARRWSTRPARMAWNELASPDLDASAEFYRELFGWQIEPIEGGADALPAHPELRRPQQRRHPPREENEPSYWLVYFGADDIDARLGQGRRARREPPWSARWTSAWARSPSSRTPRAPCSRCSPASSTTDRGACLRAPGCGLPRARRQTAA